MKPLLLPLMLLGILTTAILLHWSLIAPIALLEASFLWVWHLHTKAVENQL